MSGTVAPECADCLTEPIPCTLGCGQMVRAGDGHPDCPNGGAYGGWLGYWICDRCGHCTRHHNRWWDDDMHGGGFACDFCDDCDDAVMEPEPFDPVTERSRWDRFVDASGLWWFGWQRMRLRWWWRRKRRAS